MERPGRSSRSPILPVRTGKRANYGQRLFLPLLFFPRFPLGKPAVLPAAPSFPSGVTGGKSSPCTGLPSQRQEDGRRKAARKSPFCPLSPTTTGREEPVGEPGKPAGRAASKAEIHVPATPAELAQLPRAGRACTRRITWRRRLSRKFALFLGGASEFRSCSEALGARSRSRWGLRKFLLAFYEIARLSGRARNFSPTLFSLYRYAFFSPSHVNTQVLFLSVPPKFLSLPIPTPHPTSLYFS